MRRLAVAVCLVLAAGGCSEGDPGGFGPGVSPPATTVPPSPSPDLALGEGQVVDIQAPGGFRFDRSEIALGRGERVTFVFRNADGQRHTFTVDELNLQMAPEAGEAVRLSITIPEYLGGRYSFYCAIPGHRAGGMEGTAVIE